MNSLERALWKAQTQYAPTGIMERNILNEDMVKQMEYGAIAMEDVNKNNSTLDYGDPEPNTKEGIVIESI